MTLRAKTHHPAPFVVILLVACCGGSREQAKAPGDVTLDLALDHEACDTGSSAAQKIDTNGDGKPDIIKVMAGGHETCRMEDLNHDGRPDSYLYFDANGALRRVESDFDRDGFIDEIDRYSGGVIVRKDRETNLDRKLDTWDFYKDGKIQKRLRDSDGDGKVDQWWTWPDPNKPDCAVIASDHDNDGQPDPNSVVDVCALGATGLGAGPDAGAAGRSASPPPASSASKPADGGAAASGSGATQKESQ
jgi:hypothetical protein